MDTGLGSESNSMIVLTATDVDGTDTAQAPDAAGATGLTIKKNAAASTYEAVLEGRTVAGVVYQESGNRVTLLATSVFPEFRGKGVAGALLRSVLDELRTQGKSVSVSCPFTTAFVADHPEYADFVDIPRSGRANETSRSQAPTDSP